MSGASDPISSDRAGVISPPGRAPQPPEISVVIPACRRPELLANCLAALAPGVQTLSPDRYEVIVSDDSPPRESMETLVAGRFPWARWVPGPRRGPGANRNAGAAQARGAWLAFTDDDCLPSPGWLAAFAQQIPTAVETGISVLEGRTSSGTHRLSVLAVAPINESGNCLWSCNLAVTRALFRKLGGFDVEFPFPHLEDVDLRLRLVDAGERWRFVPDAEVIHPPRPLRPIFQQVPGHESSFYLARKRGVPVASTGLSLPRLARGRTKDLLSCRNLPEFAIVGARFATEMLLLCAWFLPLWTWRYREGSKHALAARTRFVRKTELHDKREQPT